MCPNIPSKLIRSLWANTIALAQGSPNTGPTQGLETSNLFGMQSSEAEMRELSRKG